MPARGAFIVRGSMDEVLDELVKTCSELKAKINKVDKEKHEIEGKSKTTWLKWGSDFHISIFKGQSDVMVVMDDLAFGANDFFIRDFYKAFSKRVPCSQFEIGAIEQTLADSRLDRQKDLVMPGEGAPDMVADIPDDHNKMLPQAAICKKCGTSNSADNDYCTNCKQLLSGCPNCGHVPEVGMSFCTKCGSPLN